MQNRSSNFVLRLTPEEKEFLTEVAKKTTRKGNRTEAIINGIKLLDSLQTLADKHAKGSLEVLLFMIEEKFKG